MSPEAYHSPWKASSVFSWWRQYPIARWRGEDLRGKRIFVYGEQGLGDEIMFASCIPDLIARGAHCLLDCNPRLRELMRDAFPALEVLDSLSRPDSPQVIDIEAELCAPIGSLPRFLRTTREAFGGGKAYLRADARRLAAWREQLAALGPRPAIGISWRGGLARTGRAQRSLALETLLPLLRMPGVQWVSLQHDAAPEELAAFETRHGIRIAHWPEAHAAFTDTAALICALDREGVYTLSEGRALEKLGVKPGERVGTSALEAYADMPEFADAFRRALAGEVRGTDDGASLDLGIGGSRSPSHLKCLHAHVAFALARPGYELGERIFAEVVDPWPSDRCCSV